jgi:hypothetical protein
VGSVVVDVSSYTMIQAAARDEVRARVFGVLEGLAVAAMGLGALVGSLLAGLVGIRAGLALVALIPLVCAAVARRLVLGGFGATSDAGQPLEPALSSP